MDRKKGLELLCLVFGLLFFTLKPVYAASSVLSVSPVSGTFDKEFTVQVQLDGHGDIFNAAEAKVKISDSLSLQNLIPGDCNFSFLQNPSLTDSSFKGVLLGKSLKKCTVYTLTLAPISKGAGTITFSDAKILRFGDAVNVLSSLQNGSYTLVGSVTLQPTPTLRTSKDELYSVALTVVTQTNEPVQETEVTLTPSTSGVTVKGKTDSQGAVQFFDLNPGIYSAKVGESQSENIVNVNGANHAMVLGIKVENIQKNSSPQTATSKTPMVLVGIIVLLLVIIVALLAFVLKLKQSKKE